MIHKTKMILQSKLKTADKVHPALKSLAEKYSGEVNIDFLFRKENQDRIALNLVSEATGEKRTIGISPRSATLARSHSFLTSITSEVVSEEVYQYFVEFGYSISGGKKIRNILLRSGLEDVDCQRTGILQLEHIATDLRKVYGLSYTPHIYNDGIFWK